MNLYVAGEAGKRTEIAVKVISAPELDAEAFDRRDV